MMQNKIRTGIIGLGRIGWNYHAKEINRHSEYDLIVVSDQDKNKQIGRASCRERV